jgi:hypothetical protein
VWREINTFSVLRNLILKIPQNAEFLKFIFWNREMGFFAATPATW